MIPFKEIISQEDTKIKLPRLPVDDKLLEHVRKLGGLGLTPNQIAAYYGHTTTQWNAKVKRNPELDLAIRQGKAKKIEVVSNKLWERIEKNNMTAIMFFLKTQAGWRENNSEENEEKDSKNVLPAIKLTVNDPIEAARIYKQIMIGS